MEPPQPHALSIRDDLSDIESIGIVNSLLEIICRTTGMRFSAVARVTDTHWTALAVRDGLSFGLKPGGELDLHTTLCRESRAALEAILIEQASADATYCGHHTPRMYGFESYVSVPIVLADDVYFGNLCALDPLPAAVKAPHVVDMFKVFADVLASQLNNIRGRRRAESATEQEQEVGRGRERFVAMLGHDLRNPLAAITTGVAALERLAHDPEKVRGIARRMDNSARRMRLLVDDLMDFARGRFGGGVGMAMAAFTDADVAFTQVVEEAQLAHPGRDMEIDIAIGRSLRGDRARLQQLLSNLIQNALVHGSPDTPVQVRARVVGGTPAQLLLQVTNGGPPISAADQAKLFEAFSYGRPSGKASGLGLGLFICAEIVKSHGGSLQVSSREGEPTVFEAVLPLD